jgi:hypothetical protein
VYAICSDAPDGKVRLGMKFCVKREGQPGQLPGGDGEAGGGWRLSERCACAYVHVCGCASMRYGSLSGPWWVLHPCFIPPPLAPSPALLPCQGGLRLSSVLSILVQATAGLLHLRSLGILHRVLRAANILITGLA